MNWSDLLIAGFLLLLSSLLLFLHMASWRKLSRGDLPAAALEFHRRRHQRRSLASGLIGVVGIAIIGGMWLENGWQPVIYWCVVAAIVLWIAWLAMADLFNANQMLRQIDIHHAAERTELLAQAERLRTVRSEE